MMVHGEHGRGREPPVRFHDIRDTSFVGIAGAGYSGHAGEAAAREIRRREIRALSAVPGRLRCQRPG
jgi:hypothetical protein